MHELQKRIEQFKNRVKRAFTDVFDSSIGRPAKKAIITVIGVCITLLGLVLVIFPGPAILVIPVGLGILALEYPMARKWLRKFQVLLSASAKRADDFFARRKAQR